MTIDEAIFHALEVAKQNEISAITYKNCKEIKTNMYEKLTAEKAENDCRECAADNRQLVKRGKWEIPVSVGNGIHFCSVCRNEAYWDTDYGQQLFDYCPYCGARMKEG